MLRDTMAVSLEEEERRKTRDEESCLESLSRFQESALLNQASSS